MDIVIWIVMIKRKYGIKMYVCNNNSENIEKR
ncbi:hypothetical protein B0H39_001336 [Clostridium beijerinckii]|jgi:hypothetical protein|nr:hypothetical protein [Clostridium beijerinckii]NOV70866.1 hypothetical protein [Clostridium beijerinckii]NOW33785.1 hypothetical protein [Clostridium beijerinckii]NOW83455.1 hypothetical protein [Clostridium beijerinckii]